jgi:uncharacterized membrane protein YedE/YeeE
MTLVAPLVGGALIGLSATLLLGYHGKIAGISGILATSLGEPRRAVGWRIPFLLGLVLTGTALGTTVPAWFGHPAVGLGTIAIAGVLVGVGTRLGNGCTSGHGVVGLSRLSPRSFVATLTFIAVGMITTYLLHHLRGAV